VRLNRGLSLQQAFQRRLTLELRRKRQARSLIAVCQKIWSPVIARTI
jgi:hypothetical protein